MNTKLKDKLYNITFVLHDLTNKPIRNLPYEIKNGKKLVKKGTTNVQGEITLKYIGGNTLTVFVHKDIDQTMKKIGEIHTPSKNIKVKLISPKMKFDVTLLPHDKQGKYWRGTYKVKNGDTLSKIAKQHHTTVSALLALNPNIKSPDKIYLNEKIDIIEGNEDAILKLDENTTIRVPPTKSTGTVAIDRKNKSLGMNPSSNNAKSKTVDQKIEQPKQKAIESKDKQPVTSSPRIATQTKAPMPPSSQKIEVQQEHNENKKPIAVASLNGCVCKDYDLIWGAKVNCTFRKKVVEISKELWGEAKKIEKANMLMAVFAWESGETFAVDVPNINNSGATGLIQIMPKTYTSLTKKKPTLISTSKYHGKSLTHIKELAQMTQVQYLDLVKQYFLPLKGKDVSFIDFYLQVLFPASAERGEHTVFAKNKELLDVRDHMDKRVDKFAKNNMDGWYIDASGKLHKDGKKDGKVMKSEIAAAVEHYQTDGLSYKSDYKDHKGSITATSTTQVTDYQKSKQQGAAEKSECNDGCSIKPTSKNTKKRIIVLDPGHGILGNNANVGTQIRLLELKTSFGNSNFKVGQKYSWQDLPDEIIQNAHKYFKFIENKDPNCPTEAEYVFNRAVDLKKMLEELGHTVILTRDKKETISYTSIPNISACKELKILSTSPINFRNEIANKAKADYFISLHCDGLENLTSNYAVMCYIDENGRKLADKVIGKYTQIKGTSKSRPDLGVLKNKAKNKLLIELGFMTTPSHMKILIKNHSTIVNDIYSAISEHINEN